VQTGEGDELPAVAELGEALDICFLLVAGHGCFPVERGGEVVCESVIFVISFATKKRDWMIGGGGVSYFCSGQTAWTPSANSFACA